MPEEWAGHVFLPDALVEGIFLRRVKRFSVEVDLDGSKVWAHCNDTGAMLGLLVPGARVLLSRSDKRARKLPFSLERVWVKDGFWVGVNSSHPNRIFEAAFQAGLLTFTDGYQTLRREVAHDKSRIDARLDGPGLPALWVECKNSTLVVDGVALFPDAPSARARKHLETLMEIRARRERAAMFYLVQRPDARFFGPAGFIDGEYARLFYAALEAGVEIHVYSAALFPHSSCLGKTLKIPPFQESRAWR